MAGIRAVIFDLDDTLYDCSGQLVDSARRRAAAAMVKAGLPCTEEEAYNEQVRLEQVYGPMLDTFERIAAKFGCSKSVVAAALAAYNSDDVEDIQPFDGVHDVLADLRSEGYLLLLVTTGIYSRQLKKIEKLKLAGCFDDTVINDGDTGLPLHQCFRELLKKHHIAPEETAVVGDRIFSEIKIGNIAGMTTIQYLHGRFKDTQPKSDLEVPDYRIGGIHELARTLHVAGKKHSTSGLRVVVIGGGTGLPIVLGGLKKYTENLTAVVTVTDSGRSSGMIRNDLGVLPPGDIRNCLVALSSSERLLHDLFQYRFPNGLLEGMSFGNLFIATLAKITGSFEHALKHVSEILAIRGRVLPSTYSDTHICATTADGKKYEEEVNVRMPGKAPIKEVYLKNPDVPGVPEVIEEIRRADLIVLGPGSLFTSVIANLLVKDVGNAIVRSKARRAYVCNIVTQPGQTDGFDAVDHVRTILKYTGEAGLDYVILNDNVPPQEILQRYEEDGAELVRPGGIAQLGINVITADLIENLEEKRVLWAAMTPTNWRNAS